jgi:hypothetical protein
MLVAAISAAGIAPASAEAWKVVGQIGGPTQGIAVEGDHVYVGVGMQLVVLDASNPAEIRQIGATTPFPHFVEHVAIRGSLAFVAAGSGGLRLVDVSDPVAPSEIGWWDSRGYTHDLAINGSIACVADGPYGLRLVDISNPAQPLELGSAYGTNDALGVAVDGRYAYVAAAGAGLLIADVSDPRHPVELGLLATDGYAFGVTVAGTTAYLADGWEGVKLVDVSDPAHPRLIGVHETRGWAVGVTLAGTTLVVADAFGGVRLLDVGNPANLVEIGSARANRSHVVGVAVSGSTAFVADRNRGVRALNLGGGELAEIGSFRSLGFANAVALTEGFAYVADANGRLTVVGVSDPAQPSEIGSLEVGGTPYDLTVRDRVVYMTTKGAGLTSLYIVDASDPAHPALAGQYEISTGQPKGVEVSGGHAYLAVESGLEIVSVADPAHPLRTALLRTGVNETVVAVALQGSAAYCALQMGGLAVVDVSDPTAPVRRGTFRPGAQSLINYVAVEGNRAFVADSFFGLRIIDVSNPDRPGAVAELATGGPRPQTLVVSGSRVFLACGDGGLLVANVDGAPTQTGSYASAGYTRKVAVAGSRAFLADGPGGLLILEMTPGAGVAKGVAPIGDAMAVVKPYHPPPPESPPATAAFARTAATASADCRVTSRDDAGAGTLRSCLQGASAGTTITFDPSVFPPAAPASIRLAASLPGIASDITIDGSDAGVVIDGSGLPTTQTSFGLTLRFDRNVIRGLQIVGFPGNGIQVNGSDNVIGGDRGVGRGPTGQGNVLSANRDAGIMITGDAGTASRNVVIGNLIGTDARGTAANGNGMDGVWLQRATDNIVGGAGPRDRNIVSANGWSGINMAGESTRNIVEGNYAGTDITGSVPLGNRFVGIMMGLGAFGNTVRENVVSGNEGSGVGIDDDGSSFNAIVGNLIGTDATGTRAVPNRGHGIWMNETLSSFNRVGGARDEERNIVSGNLGAGMGILSDNNIIRGNYVGTDITGRNALGNAGSGIETSRSPNVIGGTTAREANVIAANGRGGVATNGSYSTVLGNVIGTRADGVTALGNDFFGVALGGSRGVVQTNVVAHTAKSGDNGGEGVVVRSGHDCVIRRNSIHDNAAAGIENDGQPAAPRVTSVTIKAVSGTACANCEVEIFSDSSDEGRLFEGSTFAGASGLFTFAKTGGMLIGLHVTATATDREGRTSRFSVPAVVPPRPPRGRPVRRP